jgi:flagellar biosynthesis protein FlhA
MLVVAILAMMVLPLPPLLLDAFFTINISVALMVMMVAAYMMQVRSTLRHFQRFCFSPR